MFPAQPTPTSTGRTPMSNDTQDCFVKHTWLSGVKRATIALTYQRGAIGIGIAMPNLEAGDRFVRKLGSAKAIGRSVGKKPYGRVALPALATQVFEEWGHKERSAFMSEMLDRAYIHLRCNRKQHVRMLGNHAKFHRTEWDANWMLQGFKVPIGREAVQVCAN